MYCSDISNLLILLHFASFQDFIFVYRPTLADFRHKITISKSRRNECRAHITCKKIKKKSSSGVIDTSKKVYIPRRICGFLCHLEPGVLEKTKNLLEALTEDFEMLRCLLPQKACELLQHGTPVWINKSLTYGDADEPIVADSMCFHPHKGQVIFSFFPVFFRFSPFFPCFFRFHLHRKRTQSLISGKYVRSIENRVISRFSAFASHHIVVVTTKGQIL